MKNDKCRFTEHPIWRFHIQSNKSEPRALVCMCPDRPLEAPPDDSGPRSDKKGGQTRQEACSNVATVDLTTPQTQQ